MGPEASGQKQRHGGIDPAALAAACLAAAISLIAPPGPFGPSGIVIGATIVMLILAYDVDPHRTGFQSLAYAAVVALIVMLALGYPLELCFTSNFKARLEVLKRESRADQSYSDVPNWVLFVIWAALTSITWHIDRRRAAQRIAPGREPHLQSG